MSETYTDSLARKSRLEGLETRIARAKEMASLWNNRIASYLELIKEAQAFRDHWIADVKEAERLQREIAQGVEP